MSTRKLLYLTAVGAVIAAALSYPAAGHADVGDQICSQLDVGFTPDQITAQLHQGDPRYNSSTAARTVWDAIIEQCNPIEH